MSHTFEVAIVGGGPAGAAAAITAARAGVKTLLLDRDTFPRPKVCGEFVSAESLHLLGTLIGTEHPLLKTTPALSAGRLFFRSSVIPTLIEPAARSIPRFELDHALWDAALRAGADARAGTCVNRISGDGPFVIEVEGQKRFEVKSVIHAAGRWSGLRKALKPPPSPKWIGVKAHMATPDAGDSVDLYFFRHGYCGVQPVRPGVVNVCAMVRADIATRLEDVFPHHPALQGRARSFSALGEGITTAPLVHDTPQPVDGNALQVGDAAGFIDPFLGDGISLALQTGVQAARALLPVIAGGATLQAAAAEYAQQYQERVRPAFQHAARLRRVLAVSQPFQPAVTGLLRIPHITEWLLRKTRAQALDAETS